MNMYDVQVVQDGCLISQGITSASNAYAAIESAIQNGVVHDPGGRWDALVTNQWLGLTVRIECGQFFTG